VVWWWDLEEAGTSQPQWRQLEKCFGELWRSYCCRGCTIMQCAFVGKCPGSSSGYGQQLGERQKPQSLPLPLPLPLPRSPLPLPEAKLQLPLGRPLVLSCLTKAHLHGCRSSERRRKKWASLGSRPFLLKGGHRGWRRGPCPGALCGRWQRLWHWGWQGHAIRRLGRLGVVVLQCFRQGWPQLQRMPPLFPGRCFPCCALQLGVVEPAGQEQEQEQGQEQG